MEAVSSPSIPGRVGWSSVGTVTAQLLYEIGSPHYLNPDVTSLFESISLTEVGPDRVMVSGVRGEPPPPDLKVAVNLPGWVQEFDDVRHRSAGDRRRRPTSWSGLYGKRQADRSQFATVDVRLMGEEISDPQSNDRALSYLRVSVMDPDAEKVGRRFSESSRRAGTFELSRFLPDHSAGRGHRLCRLLARHHPGRSGADAGGHR